MEKERRIKTLSLVALIVAVLGLTVAFAALSQTLTINGTASVNASEWDIHFDNLSEPILEGDASVITTPTINGTSISNINVSLTKPGDSVTYSFDVINSGSIDAIISNITSSVPEEDPEYETKYKQNYDWDGDGIVTEYDLKMVQEMLEYEINYDDYNGNMFSTDGRLNGSVLNAGEIKHVTFKIKYYSGATELPKGQIIDGPISLKITYVQK